MLTSEPNLMLRRYIFPLMLKTNKVSVPCVSAFSAFAVCFVIIYLKVFVNSCPFSFSSSNVNLSRQLSTMNGDDYRFVLLEMRRGYTMGRTNLGLTLYIHNGFVFVEAYRDRGVIFLKCENQACPGRAALNTVDHSSAFCEDNVHNHIARYVAFTL
jgi:hypothetical protein